MTGQRLRNTRRKGGYILFEAVVSMGLLSVSVLAINSAMRQAILVKAQARDYTQARFLLEEKIAEIELQPLLVEMEKSGVGEGEMRRFRWSTKVSKIPLPEPPLPPNIPPERMAQVRLRANYMAKIEAVVSWTRAGQQHEERLETLWGPEKIWQPPPPTPGGPTDAP